MRRPGREVAAGAGGDPAPECRVRPALREEPQRPPVRPQRVVDRGSGGAAADVGGERHRVHLVDAGEPLEVERHDRPLAGRWRDPADHRGAAPERDARDARVGRPLEDAADVVVVIGAEHRVDERGQLAVERAHDVAVRVATRVPDPVHRVGRRERRERGRDVGARRRWQPARVRHGDRGRRRGAEPVGHDAGEPGQRRVVELSLDVAPPPPRPHARLPVRVPRTPSHHTSPRVRRPWLGELGARRAGAAVTAPPPTGCAPRLGELGAAVPRGTRTVAGTG